MVGGNIFVFIAMKILKSCRNLYRPIFESAEWKPVPLMPEFPSAHTHVVDCV